MATEWQRVTTLMQYEQLHLKRKRFKEEPNHHGEVGEWYLTWTMMKLSTTCHRLEFTFFQKITRNHVSHN